MRSLRVLGFVVVSAALLLIYLLRPEARTESGTAVITVVVCVLLSVLGLVPVWGLTFALWVLAPIALLRFGSEYSVANVVTASWHPVLIVFFTGFAFAAAARRHLIDERFARFALRTAHNDHLRLLALLAATTVWLSAWISNVAAAALLVGAVQPLVRNGGVSPAQHRSLMLTIAIAANLGGMASPIGTGANAVAIAAIAQLESVTFPQWMLFATPLTAAMVAGVVVVGVFYVRPKRTLPPAAVAPSSIRPLDKRTATIFTLTVLLWVLEPLHHLPGHLVGIAAVFALLASRALDMADLRTIDWGTLLLIAGGVGIGSLIQKSGAAVLFVQSLPLADSHPQLALFLLCLLTATLSAVMSNTGSAAMLIPIALAILPHPSTAIILALATTFGFPFVISTPPNALAVRHGVRSADLLLTSLVAMLAGSAVLATTGPTVLKWLGLE